MKQNILNKKFKKGGTIYVLFEINKFFLDLGRSRIRIRTYKSDPDPNKSRSDPQHCGPPVLLKPVPVRLF